MTPESIDTKPAVKRARKPIGPTRDSLHEVGTQAFAKPFTPPGTEKGNAEVKKMRVLVNIIENNWCERSKQWQCRVQTEGSLLPLGTEMWLPEKLLDAGFKVGEFLNVKVNGGWCEGEVVGKTVDGEGESCSFCVGFCGWVC